jgi:hypothetical protein
MEKHLSVQQLPQALRTQLGEVQPGDPRGLAARTDRLWSVHAPSGGDGRAGRCGSGCNRQAGRQGAAEASSADEVAAEAASRGRRLRPRPAVALVPPALPPPTLLHRTRPG